VFNDRVINPKRFVGSGGLIEILYLDLPGGTAENHKIRLII